MSAMAFLQQPSSRAAASPMVVIWFALASCPPLCVPWSAKRILRYRIVEKLGSDGTGVVFEAD